MTRLSLHKRTMGNKEPPGAKLVLFVLFSKAWGAASSLSKLKLLVTGRRIEQGSSHRRPKGCGGELP